ncbi:hypothetical protein QZH41_010364, partial [Actinostola sp. cb2023]
MAAYSTTYSDEDSVLVFVSGEGENRKERKLKKSQVNVERLAFMFGAFTLQERAWGLLFIHVILTVSYPLLPGLTFWKNSSRKVFCIPKKKKQKKDLVIIDEEMMNSASSSNTDVVDAIAQVTSETSLIKDEVIQLVKDEVSQIKDDLFQIKDEVTQMKDDVIQQVKDEISQIKHEITSTLNDAAYQGDIDSHLAKLAVDIKTIIPDEDHQGMAVIDWEYWRPVFDRNWDDQSIYRNMSMALVQQQHPSWSKWQIQNEARIQFESAAKNYMQSSIQLGHKLRPKALWGYYGFPRCYNYHTCECSNHTIEQNNQISWLFDSSSVILPSIYLSSKHKYDDTSAFAKGNILEAIRVSNMTTAGRRLPVFPYVRIVYSSSALFLNK